MMDSDENGIRPSRHSQIEEPEKRPGQLDPLTVCGAFDLEASMRRLFRRFVLPTAGALSIATLGCIYSRSVADEDTHPTPRILMKFEAQCLVSLLPDIQDAWNDGFTVKLGDMDGPNINNDAYYGFRVMVETDAPSGLLGHYVVNKRTADVWDFATDEMYASEDLEAVQRILRRTHHIDPATISRHRDDPSYIE